MNSVVTIVLLTLLVVGVIWLQARWAEEDGGNDDDPRRRPNGDAKVEREVRRLASPDPDEVREASNRLLSLGPGVIPALCARLRAGDDAEDAGDDPRNHQALVEDLVASFGLHAATPLARSLRRVVFPSPMVGAAIRIILRVGSPAIDPLVAALGPENVAGLGLVLHRCHGVPEPHVLRALGKLDPEHAHRVLQVFSGSLERHPGPVIGLFDGGSAQLRRSMVAFFGGWPSPLAAEILVRATDDPHPELRIAGARGIGLLVAEAPAPLRAAIDDQVPAVRRAALMACGALSAEGLRYGQVDEALRARMVSGSDAERFEAAAALISSGAELSHSGAVTDVLDELAPPDALDDDDPDRRLWAGRALALRASTEVPARERSILLAEGDDAIARAAACAGLVACDLRDLPALLGRAVSRCEGDPIEHFHLRLAAQRLGADALPPLLLLVRTARPAVALLAAELAASTGKAAALEGLLRSLPHRRGDAVGMVIRSHCAAFGEIALDTAAGLLTAEVGIIPTAICEFLLQYGDPERHSGALIEALGRTEAHRAPALAALECFAATAPQAVLSALDRRRDAPGGDWVRARIGLS